MKIFFFASFQDLLKIDRRVVLAGFSFFFCSVFKLRLNSSLTKFCERGKSQPREQSVCETIQTPLKFIHWRFFHEMKKKVVGRLSESFGADPFEPISLADLSASTAFNLFMWASVLPFQKQPLKRFAVVIWWSSRGWSESKL